jgi:metal-dependent amidase/aminoacylase/carboxypeptidase family protein
VRAADSIYCDGLVEKLRRCAEGAALATGAELQFQRVGIPYKAMKTNLAMAGVFERYMTTLGYSVVEPQAGLISTDMGDVSWEVPSIHAYVGIADDNVPVHSREFAQAARSKRGREGMLAAAKAVAATCLDLWSDPTLYQQVREEFDRRL